MFLLQRSLARAAIVGALIVATCAPSVVGAVTPAQRIEATREQAAKANARIDDLAAQLEERREEYLEIDEELTLTRREISEVERDLEQAEADLVVASDTLNARAASIYRSGDLGFLSVFVGISSFQDAVARLDFLRLVSSSDAAVVRSVKEARSRIEINRGKLERRRAEQVELRATAKRKQQQVDEALKEQEDYAARIDTQLKKLIAEERQRQERLARERAAAIAAAATAAGANVTSTRTFDPAALGAAHPEVVPLAKRYVGKTPYVWGGTSPSGFDCSGLVQYCYAKLGISVPRTSRQQFRIGAYIPPDRLDLLEPGDLVFFGYGASQKRIHHVAIYAGDGMMVHAPQTGQMVSVTSLTARIQSRGDYVGACRP